MKRFDRVTITKVGRYSGETGRIWAIYPVGPGFNIYEIELDKDFLYDVRETLLVKENEIQLIN